MKFLKKLILIAGVLTILDIVGSLIFAAYVFREPAKVEGRYDAAIVLYSENVRKRNDRLDFVQALQSTGGTDHFILVGGMRPLEHRIGAIDMGVELSQKGVPADHLILDERSNDTSTSISNGLQHASDNHFDSVLFVTDCMHLVRVKYQVAQQSEFTGKVSFACPKESWGRRMKVKTANYELISFIVIHLPKEVQASLVSWLRP